MKTTDELKLETAKKIWDADGDCIGINCYVDRCPIYASDKRNRIGCNNRLIVKKLILDYISKHEGETMENDEITKQALKSIINDIKKTTDKFLPIDSIKEARELFKNGERYWEDEDNKMINDRSSEIEVDIDYFKRNPDFKEQPTNKLDDMIAKGENEYDFNRHLVTILKEISKQLKEIK